MHKMVQETAAYELYKGLFPSIADLEKRKTGLATDGQREVYINQLIAEFKHQKLETLLITRCNVDQVFAFLGLTNQRMLIDNIRKLVESPGFQTEQLYALVGLPTATYTQDGFMDVIADDIKHGGYLGVRGSLAYIEKQLAVVRLNSGGPPQTLPLPAFLKILGLDIAAKAIWEIERYLTTVDAPQVDELISLPKTKPWFQQFLFHDEITLEALDEYFQIGAYLREWHWRSVTRAIYRKVTFNGLTTRSFFIGLAKLNFVFGLIYANVTSEFLSQHVQTVSKTLSDSFKDIWEGTKQWAVAIAIVALLAFIVYESQRLYWHIPRCCRRRSRQGRYTCCTGTGRFRWIDSNLARKARRYRMRFETCIHEDEEYDPEAPTYSFEYDSENDDPDVAVYYFHLREKQHAKVLMEEDQESPPPQPRRRRVMGEGAKKGY